jgi:glyoxylase-like metal-dependent hydrolase (beta-lactamase superfamily II)
MMNIHPVEGRLANSYVVEEDGRLFVVDVAVRGEKYVIGYIQNVLGGRIENVRLVICTHDDYDHGGGIHGLARQCGAQVGMPYASHSLVRKLWHDPLGIFYRPMTAVEESLRPRMWRMYLNPFRRGKYPPHPVHPARPATAPPRQPDHSDVPDYHLKNNQPLPGFPNWITVHTPGHSWDSCCFFHPQTRSLIAGDTLLGSGTKGELVTPAVYANPLQMARTVRKLKRLDPLHVYPGHGISFHGRGLLDHL